MLIHRRGHSAIVSLLSINCSVMGFGSQSVKSGFKLGCFSPCERLSGDRSVAQTRSTLSVISGSLGTLRRTQRGFMQPERFHVHTGNYIWLCASCYQQPPFLLGEYFKGSFIKDTNSRLSPFEGMIFINPTALFSEQIDGFLISLLQDIKGKI